MDRGNMLAPLPAVTIKKGTTCHFSLRGRAKGALRPVRTEVARAVQDAARIIRIIIFLHSAKDFPSVLRLYGIEKPSEAE